MREGCGRGWGGRPRSTPGSSGRSTGRRPPSGNVTDDTLTRRFRLGGDRWCSHRGGWRQIRHVLGLRLAPKERAGGAHDSRHSELAGSEAVHASPEAKGSCEGPEKRCEHSSLRQPPWCDRGRRRKRQGVARHRMRGRVNLECRRREGGRWRWQTGKWRVAAGKAQQGSQEARRWKPGRRGPLATPAVSGEQVGGRGQR